jgi:glutamate racemase
MDDFCFFIHMIGVFDSWLGGLQSLQYIRNYLPEYDFLYLGDTLYVPYGEKSEQRIHDRTFVCLQWLFDQWCILVILACNTASAYAIRDRQIRYPERKVLSVTVPGVEAIVHWWFHAPLLLGTKVTIETHIYESVRERTFPDYPVTRYPFVGTGRVAALEQWSSQQELSALVYSAQLERFATSCDCVILWCTHYPLLSNFIQESLPWLPLIDPAAESALQLVDYLDRHPEIDHQISKNATIRYVVTGNSTHFDELVEKVFKQEVVSERVLLA